MTEQNKDDASKENPLKDKEIVFADQTVVDALESYVDMVLQAIASAAECPGMASAWVSDQSMVWDFLHNEDISDEEMLQKISNSLGVKVTADDYIYELAIKLRDKD